MLVKCKAFQKDREMYCIHAGKCFCPCDHKGNIRVRVENQELLVELKKRLDSARR